MNGRLIAFLLFAPVIAGAQTVTGSWRIVGDTNAMPGLTLKLVELGPNLTEGIIVRGTWTSLRVGCEPASSVACYVQSDAIGLRIGAHLNLALMPASTFGLAGSLSLDLASGTSMRGGVGVTFSREQLYTTENVTFARIK